jgi:hypothetical protein
MINTLKRFLKRFEPIDLPKKNIVIVCAPRTGSTYLLNLLRSHPKISMSKNYDFYTAFGLKGRRYPVDLSNNLKGDLIETSPYNYENILGKTSTGEINIEKIHPEFYNFDSESFIKKVNKKIKEGHEFYFIQCSRDHRSTVNSYRTYKSRANKWHKNIYDIDGYYIKNYRSLRNLRGAFNVKVINFEDLVNSPVTTIKKLCEDIPYNLEDIENQSKIAVTKFNKSKVNNIFKNEL